MATSWSLCGSVPRHDHRLMCAKPLAIHYRNLCLLQQPHSLDFTSCSKQLSVTVPSPQKMVPYSGPVFGAILGSLFVKKNVTQTNIVILRTCFTKNVTQKCYTNTPCRPAGRSKSQCRPRSGAGSVMSLLCSLFVLRCSYC